MLRLFRAAANRRLIDAIHGEIVAGARQPALYLRLGAPDTFEGRFEMLALHAGLGLRALRRRGDAGDAAARDLARDLAEALFRHLDHTLREMGVGDLTVPRRMKKLAGAFYDRLAGYDAALAGPPEALGLALRRHLPESAEGLAAYVRALAAVFEARAPRALAGPPGLPAAEDFVALEASA